MTETPDRLGEERARKRRWLSLAEIVGVGGLLIAGAGLYLSWSDRQDKVTTESQESRFRLRTEVVGDGAAIRLSGDEQHPVDGASVIFPTALGVTPKEAMANEIERDWFGKALLKATDGGADDQTGTLPVLLRIRHADGDAIRTESGVYDVVWRTEGRTFPLGRSLKLEALRLRERGGTAARLDALWRPSGR